MVTMEDNDEEKSPSFVNAIAMKFRKVFHDKSMKALTEAFLELTGGVYKKSSDSAKTISNCKSLNLIEFKMAIMKSYKDMFTYKEIKDIFLFLDTTRDGRVDLKEFLSGIRGSLNEYRQRIVNFIFYRLDGNTSGFIEESELRHFYKHSLLPDILSLQIEPSMKAKEFMSRHGFSERISHEQFNNMYLTKSLKMNSDTKFKNECMDEWLFRDEDANAFMASQAKSARQLSFALPMSATSSVMNSSTVSLLSTDSQLKSREVSPSGSPTAASKSPRVSRRVSDLSLFDKYGSSESMASVDAYFVNAPSVAAVRHYEEDYQVGLEEADAKMRADKRFDAAQRALILEQKVGVEQRRHSTAVPNRPQITSRRASSAATSPKMKFTKEIEPKTTTHNQDNRLHIPLQKIEEYQASNIQNVQNVLPFQSSPTSSISFYAPSEEINSHFFYLRTQIEEQVLLINAQESKIDRQHMMIRAMQEQLGFK